MADNPVPQENTNPLEAIETADLESKVTELRDEFAKQMDADAPLAELNELAADIDAIDAELTARADAAEAEAVERQALADRIAPVVEPEVEAVEPEAVADESDVVAEAEAITEEAAQPEAVTAAAPPSARNIARRTVAPTAPETNDDLVITASADVPGYSNGERIDRLGIAAGLHSRARGLGDSKGRGTRFSVASIESQIPAHLQVSEGSDADSVMTEAVREQLAGKDAAALVASGGWCAPSETLYDMFSVESRDGLLDLPSIGRVTRRR